MSNIQDGLKGFLLLVIVSSGLFLTCDIGLGDSVDTKPPLVEITYPPVQSIIKNTFTMAGSASDETSLSGVTVSMQNTVTAATFGPYSAVIDPTAHTWSAVINNLTDSSAFEIRDGVYEMTVIATDAAGRKSVATTTYELDNTAPVLVLERPGTNGLSSGVQPEVYGTELKVTGSANDDHALEKLVFTVFDETGTQVASPISVSNISGVGMDITLAKSFDPPSTDDEVALNNLYNAIYTGAGATQKFYCTITVSDEAREFNPPSAVASADNSRGNTNGVYYVYDEIYSAIFSATGYAVTMKDLTAMFNGSYADSAKAATVLAALGTYARNANAWSTASASFSLNPNNNPNYEAMGFTELSASNPIDGIKKANATDLTILISTGRDGVPLLPDTFRIYLDPCGTSGATPVAGTADDIVLLNTVAELGSNTAAIADRNLLLTKSGTDYSVFLNIGTLQTKNNYLLKVEGSDQSGNLIEASNYGFRVITNGKPPVVTFAANPPSATPINLSTINSTSVILEGTVESETGLASMPATVQIKKTSDSSIVTHTIAPSVTLPAIVATPWTLNIDTSTDTTTSDSYEYSVTMTANDDEGNSTLATRVFYIDRMLPSVEVTSISPIVSVAGVDKVNGLVTIKGRVTDNDKVASASYSINSDPAVPITNFASWTIPNIDTRSYDDAGGIGTLSLAVTVIDRAGNSYIETTSVDIDQSTDKPVISLTNADTAVVAPAGVTIAKNLFGTTSNNRILGTITDDDILATSIAVNIDGVATDPISIASPSTSYTLNYQPKALGGVALSEGVHTIEFVMTDGALGASATTGAFCVGIDAGDPSLAITSLQDQFKSGIISVTGTASDGSGLDTLVPLVRDEAVDISVPVAGDTSWSDSFNVGTSPGTFTKTYIATDKYGRTTNAVFSYRVDVTPPTVGIDTPTVAGSYIKKENVFQAQGTALDVGSIVSAVSYKVQPAGDAAPLAVDGSWQTAAGTANWTASVNLSTFAEGAYKIYVASKDSAGNYSDITLATSSAMIYADGQIPDITLTATPTAYVYGDFTIEGSSSDTYFDTIVYSRTGPVTGTVNGTISSTPGAWTLPQNGIPDDSYTYTFTAMDKAGRTMTKTVSTVKDIIKPVIEISSITKQLTANARNDNVNGTITVKGTISDNDKVQTGTYTLSIGGTPVAGYLNQGVGANLASWTITVDTTAAGFTDLSDLTVTVNATDRAGNPALPVAQVVHIDQSTNKPVLALSNANVLIAADTGVTASTNLFGTTGNNKLLGTISDDDGLVSYHVVIKDYPGATVVVDETKTVTGNPTLISLAYTLPATEGIYTVAITPTDCMTPAVSNAYAPFYIGVDAGAPSLAITSPAQNNYYSGTIIVSGSVTDGSNVLTLVRNGSPDTLVTSTPGSWSDSLDVGVVTGTYTKTYTATDKYGNTTLATFGYQVDATAPSITLTTADSYIKKENVFQVAGDAADVGSSVNAVLYKVQPAATAVPLITDAGWIAAVGTTNWTASINLVNNVTYPEGDYRVYVVSKDQASNYSTISLANSVLLHADKDSPTLNVTTTPAAYVHGAIGIEGNSADTYLNNVTYSRVATNAGTTATGPLTLTAGAWSINDALADDTYTYTITATDLAGRSTVQTIQTVKDTAVPTIEISSITKQLTANSRDDNVNGTITVKGTISDNDKVQAGTYTLSIGGTPVAGYLNHTVGANLTSWTFTVDTTAAGFTNPSDLTVTINATDRAGNPADAVSQVVHIDQSTDKPVVTVTAPISGAYIGVGSIVRGTITDDDGVDTSKLEINYYNGTVWSGWLGILANGGTVTGSSATDKSFTFTLPALGADGAKQVQVRGSDTDTTNDLITVEPIASPAISFLIDTTNPVINITSPATDDTYHAASFGFSGNVVEAGLDTLKISIDGGSKTTLLSNVTGTTAWSRDLVDDFGALMQGRHTVTLEAIDKVGRTTSLQRSFYKDTQGPSVIFSNLTDGAVPATAVLTPDTIRGTASDAYSPLAATFEYRFDTDTPGTWTTGTFTGANWAVPIPAGLTEGARTVILRCKDNLDNETYTTAVAFRLDRDVPDLTFTPPTKTVYNDDFSVDGTASDVNGIASVAFYVDDVLTYTVTVTPSPWNYTVEAGSQVAGSHSLKIITTDGVGRTSQSVFSYTVDKTAPIASIAGITPIADTNKLNGTATIAASATDASGIDIYDYVTTAVSVTDGTTIGAGDWISFGAGNTLKTFDTTNAGVNDWEDTVRRIWVRAKDNAGNYGYIYQDRTIDQDSNRPVVKLSNVIGDLADLNYPTTLKNSNIVYGTITDDDGIATLQVKNALGDGWTTVTPDGSAWEYPATGVDGSKNLYFLITDTDGGTFETSAAQPVATATLPGRPRIQKAVGVYLDALLPVVFKVDTVTPEIGATVTSDRLTPYTFAAADTNTVPITTNLAFGGTSSKFAMRILATDANGIKSVGVKIDGPSGTTVSATASTTWVNAPIVPTSSIVIGGVYTIATYDTTDFMLFGAASNDIGTVFTATKAGSAGDNGTVSIQVYDTGEIDIGSINDGSAIATITVEDNSGLKSTATRTIIVDKIKPLATHSTPRPVLDPEVNGEVTVKGSASDDGSGLKSIMYQTGLCADLDPASPAWLPANGTFSWQIDYKVGTGVGVDNNIIDFYTGTLVDLLDVATGSFTTAAAHGYAPGTAVYFGGLATLPDEMDSANVAYYSDKYFVIDDADGNDKTFTVSKTVGGPTMTFTGTSANLMVSKYARDIDNNGVWELPIMIRAEDVVGNVYVDTVSTYVLRVDPAGDKAKAIIVYPDPAATNRTMGGTIRIFGTAIDDDGVDSVYMQIDANGDGTYDALDDNFGTSTDKWFNAGAGLPASGNASWNRTINGSGEFNPPGAGTRTIHFRVRAKDINGKFGAWSDSQTIYVDNSVPKIGSSEQLNLVQYTDATCTTVAAEQAYVADMYIKGTWYLVGSIEDESDIFATTISGSITGSLGSGTISGNLGTTDGTSGAWFTHKTFTDPTPDTTGYSMRIPLATASYGSGAYAFTITATDNSLEKRTFPLNISVKFDNTAPEQDATYAIPSITQSNKVYTISSNLSESASGFSRLAFYFERNVSAAAEDRVYNVMEDKTGDANKTLLSGLLPMIEGLPCQRLTGVGRPTTRSLTSADLKNTNKNVRVGGLVYIGGMYHKILTIAQDASEGTITWADEVSMTLMPAAVAYAMVVDNTNAESVVYQPDNVTIKEIKNDDNDGMPESIIKTGTTYVWDATFNSKNIPDGPIELHLVAFDKAGNYSENIIVTKVENNGPRVAAVTFGTDLNGDNSVTALEKLNTYSALISGAAQRTANVSSSAFIATGKSSIDIDVVGGNGILDYVLTVGSDTTPITGHALANTVYLRDDGATATNTIELTEAQLSEIGETVILTAGTAKSLVVTIWDSTEELAIGLTTQSATLTAPIQIDVVDGFVPKTVIQPVFWHGTGDGNNSLYGGLTANGHIEIPNDATDPSVSGEITVRGTAYDNQRISAIYARIDGMTMNGMTDASSTFTATKTFNSKSYYLVATYILGVWASQNTDSGEGWSFVPATASHTQAGHFVTWNLNWNTMKLGAVADLNRKIELVVLDKGNNPSGFTSTQDATIASSAIVPGETYQIVTVDTGTPTKPLTACGASANMIGNIFIATDVGNGNGTVKKYTELPTYQVDVVPYITKVTTNLSQYFKSAPSAIDRTARGHYPVYSGSSLLSEAAGETITLDGFNFNGDATNVYINGSTPLTVTEVAGKINTSIQATIGLDNDSTMKSGPLTAAIGTVTTQNNSNSLTAVTNLKPNNVNNNLLDDDVYLDIWQFTETGWSKGGGINNPNMKVSPTGQIGFAFGHSIVYFSMPGLKNGETAYYSQTAFQKNYGWFTANDFAFDARGNTYGAVLCPDTAGNAGETANFTWFSRQAGLTIAGMTSLDGNYNAIGTNNYRLSNTSQDVNTNGGVTPVTGPNDDPVTNIWRIYSPSVATTMVDPTAAPATGTNPVRVYFAYYDDLTKEVRFRYGTVGTNPGSITARGSIDDLGMILYNNRNRFTNYPPDVPPEFYQVVSSTGFYNPAGGRSTPTAVTPGQYVALAVQRINSTQDVAMIAWYDSSARQLYFSYNDDPMNLDSATSRAQWQTNAIRVDSSVSTGQNVKMVVDSEGHIHLAYYSLAGGDLKYAYLTKYDDKVADLATVDSFLSVGTNCTIDVAMSGGHQVPYIGYYCAANSGTSASAKMAYRYDFSSNAVDAFNGADDSDFYTGKWEITVIPEKALTIPANAQVSVGVYRNTAGNLTAIPAKTYEKVTGEGSPGGWALSESCLVGGNGSTNPVVGYATDTGILKMAQKRD